MKHLSILALLASVVFTFSCKNEPKDLSTEPEVIDVITDDEEDTVACYRFANDKDTIVLNIENDDSKITGTLQYHLFEKDKNTGFLEGMMVGDTLFAEYTFFSEGLESVREVAFLKKGTTFVEGYGEVEVDGNKAMFKDGAVLNFNSAMALTATDCN
jgi:hypothetical protein